MSSAKIQCKDCRNIQQISLQADSEVACTECGGALAVIQEGNLRLTKDASLIEVIN